MFKTQTTVAADEAKALRHATGRAEPSDGGDYADRKRPLLSPGKAAAKKKKQKNTADAKDVAWDDANECYSELLAELKKFEHIKQVYRAGVPQGQMGSIVHKEVSWKGGQKTVLNVAAIKELMITNGTHDEGGEDHTLHGRTNVNADMEKQGCKLRDLVATFRTLKDSFAYMEDRARRAGFNECPAAGVFKYPPTGKYGSDDGLVSTDEDVDDDGENEHEVDKNKGKDKA
jgi:hypothetical protein